MKLINANKGLILNSINNNHCELQRKKTINPNFKVRYLLTADPTSTSQETEVDDHWLVIG